MERERKRKVLVKLFISTLYLNTFIFGGGYVIMTLMKKKLVSEYHWIEEDETLDLTAITQSSPGAITVNGAVVVGYKLARMAGVLTTTTATILPPFVVISLLSMVYNLVRGNLIVSQMLEGMQAGVGVVITAVVYEMGYGIIHRRNMASMTIMTGAFIATYLSNANVIYVIIVCRLIGVVRTLLADRKGREV